MVTDLPSTGYQLSLRISVRRFRCRQSDCPQRIFTERMPELVKPGQRRTNRLARLQTNLALDVGASAGYRICAQIGAPTSVDSLLRLIRRSPEPRQSPLRIIGVDDWAWCKGQRYGTIIVDHEHGVVVDLLPDRDAASLAKWLKQHPEIRIVSRDRAEAYAHAIDEGAPSAVQVADRWHLLKNIFDSVFTALQPHRSAIESAGCMNGDASLAASKAGLPDTFDADRLDDEQQHSSATSASAKQRMERNQKIHDLHADGMSHADIARMINRTTKTVRRVLSVDADDVSCASPHRATRRSLITLHTEFLKQRWREGCRNAVRLHREIAARGFQGGITTVRTFLHAFRSRAPIRSMTNRITLREAAWSVMSASNGDVASIMAIVGSTVPIVGQIIGLGQRFTRIVRERRSDELRAWMEEASQSDSRALQAFARGLRRDFDAVHAALELPWSNGRTEGHVNRLKTIKRSMYGRAKPDLLRKRLLAFTR
jgi:transposase